MMRTSLVISLLHFSPTTESTPQWLVVEPPGPGYQTCCAGQNAIQPCRHMPRPAGKPTRRWDALRSSARRRRTVTSDPRVSCRLPLSNQAGADPRISNPIQRRTRPTAVARTRRGPKSDPGCVDDSRAGHTRKSKRRDATSWGRSPGSDASVHGGAEAMPWSQAPVVSERPKLLRAPHESPATSCELNPPKREEATVPS